MTLISHSHLPAFERLKQEGQEVLSTKEANTQDIRELHVGLYNMMPDAALEATERQFLRLIGSSNQIAQFFVHLFSPKSIKRTDKMKNHVNEYYQDLEQFKNQGLDALIITGANPSEKNIEDEVFWDEFTDLVSWAHDHVTSTICSCLATHAIFKLFYQEERILQSKKVWGVFSHQLQNKDHPLVRNINTKFDTPHSHHYSISTEQAEKHGVIVLVTSEEAGLHIATTKDFRFVFTQGHPEYDTQSLLKEYKREYNRFHAGVRKDYPPLPKNYFSTPAQRLIQQSDVFPEKLLLPYLDNTWSDTSKAFFNNWLGLVYKITHKKRKIRLMKHLDQDNPLEL